MNDPTITTTELRRPDKLQPKPEPKPEFTEQTPIPTGGTESARIYREAQEELQQHGAINWFPVILKTAIIIIRTAMNSKTTWLTVLQVAVSILGMILAGFGFDEVTGKVAVSSPTWAWIAAAVYAALKIVKGKVTADAQP